MELDTRELFRCLARHCNYREEKLCTVSKADYIARDYIYIYICILLSKLTESSWRFLKFSEALHVYIQIETFMYAISSHKKRRAKYQTEMLSWIAKQQFRCKQCFQQKAPWPYTRVTRNSTAIMLMDIHKQAIEKKKWEVKLERQAVRTKATRNALRLCLHTVDRTFIYTNFLLLWIWQI